MSYTILMQHVFPGDNITCFFWSLCGLLVFSSGQMHQGVEY